VDLTAQFQASSTAYRFDIAAETALLRAAYPFEQQRLVVFDVMEYRLLSPNDASGAPVFGASLLEHYDIANTMQQCRSSGRCVAEFRAAYDFVFMTTAPKRLVEGAATPDEENHFIFFHEVGHFFARDGIGYASEEEADIFAALWQINTFGMDNARPLIEKAIQRRAVDLFFAGDRSHFTSPALEKLLQEYNGQKQTPEDIVKRARALGSACYNDTFFARGFLDTIDIDNVLKRDMPAGDFSAVFQLGEWALEKQDKQLTYWAAVAIGALVEEGIIHKGVKIQMTGDAAADLLGRVRAQATADSACTLVNSLKRSM
jgi:hypothetical protein